MEAAMALKEGEERRVIWAIGGGKGGSGKSFITTNLGIWLSRMGAQVILIDADLGGANLHTFLGILPPALSLSDYIKRRVADLNEVLIPTAVPNLQLLSGAQDLLSASDTKSVQKQRLLRSIQKLKADYVLVDLGAGNGLHVLDFFLMSDGGILVVTPEPTSIENAYRFLKSVFYRRLRHLPISQDAKRLIDEAMDPKNELGIETPFDLLREIGERNEADAHQLARDVERFHPNLILNQVRTKKDVEIGFSIRSACQKYFGIRLHYLGYIVYDQEVSQSVRKRRPLLMESPQSKAAQCIMEIASKLADGQSFSVEGTRR